MRSAIGMLSTKEKIAHTQTDHKRTSMYLEKQPDLSTIDLRYGIPQDGVEVRNRALVIADLGSERRRSPLGCGIRARLGQPFRSVNPDVILALAAPTCREMPR